MWCLGAASDLDGSLVHAMRASLHRREDVPALQGGVNPPSLSLLLPPLSRKLNIVACHIRISTTLTSVCFHTDLALRCHLAIIFTYLQWRVRVHHSCVGSQRLSYNKNIHLHSTSKIDNRLRREKGCTVPGKALRGTALSPTSTGL